MTSPLYCLATLYNYYHAFITLWFRESEPKTSECPWDIFYSTCPNVRRHKWKKIIQNEKWKVAKIWRRFSRKINYFLHPLDIICCEPFLACAWQIRHHNSNPPWNKRRSLLKGMRENALIGSLHVTPKPHLRVIRLLQTNPFDTCAAAQVSFIRL